MLPEKFFEIGFVLIASTVFTAVITGCVFWIRWFRGTSKRNLCGDPSTDLVTQLPQPIPRWTVFDFLLMFGVMILVGITLRPPAPDNATPEAESQGSPAEISSQEDPSGENLTAATPPPDEQVAQPTDEKTPANIDPERLAKQVKNHFIANLVSFVLLLAYLRIIHGATLTHLSLIPSRDDIRRGLVATVWILAPVLLLNVILANLVTYEHPVTNLLAEESGTRTFFALFLSAALLTPIVEEFQFRLLLQGGLQQFADPPIPDGEWSNWRPTTMWPIVVTSVLFALMHLGQGAAPIPLFFLSVGLGLVYQRTGRLVPVIVVHMLLNGATLCMEFCRVNAGL